MKHGFQVPCLKFTSRPCIMYILCINVLHVLGKSTKTFALFVQINEFFFPMQIK